MKWRVNIYKNKTVVDKIPFCIEHDQQFIYEYKGYRCLGTKSQICKSLLPNELHDEFYSSVMSMVENHIRNDKKLCYRDRGKSHNSPLPHHAAYGSVLRDSADQGRKSGPGERKTE